MNNYEKKLKRLKIQSWRRGMKEVDLILGKFFDLSVDSLSEKEINLYETLLVQDDQKIFAWVSKKEQVPKEFDFLIKKISQTLN